MGQERKAGTETTHGKYLIKVIMHWIGWILQCNVSLWHCFGSFCYNDQNTLIEKSRALKYSNRAVKNVLLTIPPGSHIDGLGYSCHTL